VGENTFIGRQILVFIICLKHIFRGTTKFGGHKNILGELPPNALAPVATGLMYVNNLMEGTRRQKLRFFSNKLAFVPKSLLNWKNVRLKKSCFE